MAICYEGSLYNHARYKLNWVPVKGSIPKLQVNGKVVSATLELTIFRILRSRRQSVPTNEIGLA
jgi:hypothetical protein